MALNWKITFIEHFLDGARVAAHPALLLPESLFHSEPQFPLLYSGTSKAHGWVVPKMCQPHPPQAGTPMSSSTLSSAGTLSVRSVTSWTVLVLREEKNPFWKYQTVFAVLHLGA